jgi:hypothetical protein
VREGRYTVDSVHISGCTLSDVETFTLVFAILVGNTEPISSPLI